MEQVASPTLLGVDVVMVVTILAGLAMLAALTAVYAAVTVKDPMAKRVKSLQARRAELQQALSGTTTRKRQSLVKRNNTRDKIKDQLEQLNVLKESDLKDVQQKLAQAGIRDKEWAPMIIGARMILPIVLGAIAIYVVYWSDNYPDWGSMKRLGVFAGSLFIGYKAPDLWLKNKITKRTDAIRKGLPDALDLLVICAEAGLTIDAAFNRVAKELGRAYPELGDEFALTAIELSFLTERRKAFENLSWRVNLDAVRGVVTTMIQTERYGTPLASALRVLSAEFRNERMMRAEEKAARLPAIMTIPLILFILPVLFIVILGPAACSIADAFAGDGPPGSGT